jgi:hypothetical protein
LSIEDASSLPWRERARVRGRKSCFHPRLTSPIEVKEFPVSLRN